MCDSSLVVLPNCIAQPAGSIGDRGEGPIQPPFAQQQTSIDELNSDPTT
jgi:hypothetical protein